MQISKCFITTLSLPPKSQLLYLTLVIMQGFGSVGGCLGLGLEEREGDKRAIKVTVWVTSASALCLNKCGKNSPFGVRDGAGRCGHTGYGCRATNSRGPLDYVVALHYRRTTNQSRAPWVCRKGFLRRAGFLQLLTQNRRFNTVPQYLHQVALTVRQWQLRPAGLLHLSGLRAVLPVQLAMRGPVMWF